MFSPERQHHGVFPRLYRRHQPDVDRWLWTAGCRLSKTWQRGRIYGTLFLQGKNLTGTKYIAFTEPDPDGNSYQPGPMQELFAGVQIRF
jgi:hypothetical protein